MKKHIITVAVIGILVATATFGNRITIEAGERNTFPSNTLVNSVDCSNMTARQAIKKVTSSSREKEFVLIADNEEVARLTNLKLDYDLEDEMEKAMLIANVKEQILPPDVMKNQKVVLRPFKAIKYLQRVLAKSPICTDKSIIQTENAYVELDSGKFNIVPEIYGTSPNKGNLAADIVESIIKGKWELSYSKEQYYEIPTVTTESPVIKERQEYCQNNLAHKITYDFGTSKITLSPRQLDQLLCQKGIKAEPNQKAIKRFVRKLAKKYDTLNLTRRFRSTTRGIVYVNPGTFGYKINKSAEIKKLTANLLSSKDVIREPVYSSRGSVRGLNDIGNTYVEVDLGSQHFWYYRDGQLLLDSDIVSGDVSLNHGTITGIYTLQYKTTDVVLKGREDDGKKYESHVDFWMPFYYDYGLHDADWRGAFGGQIYQYNGSHGCVNLPVSTAANLFNEIYPGCPVVLYY